MRSAEWEKISEKMRKCEVTSFQKTSAARAFGKSGKLNPPVYDDLLVGVNIYDEWLLGVNI